MSASWPRRARCDRLVVGLNSDASVARLKGKDRPIQAITSRAEVLAALEAVDLVVVFEEDTPLELIRAVRPSVLVKGGEVILIDLVPGHSTTGMVARTRGTAHASNRF